MERMNQGQEIRASKDVRFFKLSGGAFENIWDGIFIPNITWGKIRSHFDYI